MRNYLTDSAPWQSTTLGELLTLEYGAALKENARVGGTTPVFGSNGQVGWHDRPLVNGPGIVIGRKGSVGKLAWSDTPFWPIDTAYFVSLRRQANWRWLFWLLQQLSLERLDASTGVPGLNRNDAYGLRVSEPSRVEQSWIAEILDTLEAAIREAEVVVAKLKQVKAGLLHDLLTRGIDEHGHLRDPACHPEQFQDSPLGRIPKAWQVGVLDSAVRIIDCKHYTPRFVAEGIPFIRPRNVKAEGLDFTAVDYVSLADYKLLTDKHEPAQGDIVFSRNASFGVACFVAKPLRFAIGQDVVIMTRRAAETRFVFYVLRSFITEQQVARVSTGSTFGRINLEFIRALQVVLPGLEEQKNIVRVLDAHGERFEAEELKLSKLHSLKRGLAHDLLTGRVRVKVGGGA